MIRPRSDWDLPIEPGELQEIANRAAAEARAKFADSPTLYVDPMPRARRKSRRRPSRAHA